MPCTPRQAESNRINAQQSTGPRTAEGKERARFNAVRHGLDARSLVLPGEDAAEAQSYLDGIVEALAPRDEYEADLCTRMAKLSWKLVRAERAEQTVTRVLMERAELDDKIRREVAIHDLLSADPEFERNVRSQLEESAEGCQWMIETLNELAAEIDAGKWRTEFDRRLDLICGSPTLFRLSDSRALILCRCIDPRMTCIWPPDESPPAFDRQTDVNPQAGVLAQQAAHRARVPAWRAELRAILDARIAELESLRAVRLAQTAIERASVAELATYAGDPSLERVRKAIRSTQNEQARLRKALDAHRAEGQGPAATAAPADAGAAPDPAAGPEPGSFPQNRPTAATPGAEPRAGGSEPPPAPPAARGPGRSAAPTAPGTRPARRSPRSAG